MIRSLFPAPRTPLSDALPPALPDWADWMRLAMAEGWTLGGGLSLELLFDRVEGRA